MKYHLTGFGISALVHVSVLLAALPVMLWQDKLGQVEEPQPVQLSLAQFLPAPPPPPEPPAPQPVTEPEPPKPVEKPKPTPVERPKPEKKPVEKPRLEPKPEPRQEPAPPQPAPRPVVQPAPAARPVAPVPQATPPAQAADNKAAEAAYKARLQSLIATRKQYPRMAEKAEVEGSVVVSFTVMPSGAISGARVAQSSGNAWLDKAAVQAVNAASGALPFPPEIRKAQWSFSVTVNFRLE